MKQNDGGILMKGLGRRLVYSRLRAFLGVKLQIPSLLRGITLGPGARCLDIAAGLGWASAAIARRDPSARMVALDYDATILPRTRDYLRSRLVVDRAAVCCADGKHLPFPDESFDLVLCLYGLHHFRGYLDGLREIARVLKPSGTFVLIDPIRKPGKPPGGHHGMEVPTREELTRMLDEAGFEIARSHISLGTMKAVTHRSGNQRNSAGISAPL